MQYLTGVQYLYDTINPDQLEIPPFVLEHDKAVSVELIVVVWRGLSVGGDVVGWTPSYLS